MRICRGEVVAEQFALVIHSGNYAAKPSAGYRKSMQN
jgi:hypothetical protein